MFRAIWVLALLLFPLTTFPWLPGDSVRPAALLPVLLLLVIGLLNPIRLRTLRGFESYVLFFFLIYTAVTGLILAVFWYDFRLEGYENVNPLTDFLRGWISLAVGAIFYVVLRLAVINRDFLRLSERILLGAITVSVGFAVLQWASVNLSIAGLRSGTLAFTSFFVDTATEWVGRYHGLAYEPSWLASQLTVIALPLLLARLLGNQSLGHFPTTRLPIELALLGLVLLGVLLTDSRTAIFAAIAVIFIGVLTAFGRRNMLVSLLVVLVLIGVVIPLAVRSTWIGNTISAFSRSSSPTEFALQASAGPRVSAWVAGWYTFLGAPIVGVGLGNSYRFYPDNVPSWSLGEPEVQKWLDTSAEVRPNPKNLPIKLLSETGVLGFALYFTFVLLHFRNRPRSKFLRVLYSTGFVALIFNYFSLDTFALPTEWFLLGFIMLYGKYQEGTS
jgi:hypothetical protein